MALRAFRAHTAVLQSVKVAALTSEKGRPSRPAWTPLPSGGVAAACVASAGDVVVFDSALTRLGRIPLDEDDVVVSLASLARARDTLLIATPRFALIVDAHPSALVPMRRSRLPGASAPTVLAQLLAPPHTRLLHVAVAETGAPVAFGGLACGTVVAWALPHAGAPIAGVLQPVVLRSFGARVLRMSAEAVCGGAVARAVVVLHREVPVGGSPRALFCVDVPAPLLHCETAALRVLGAPAGVNACKAVVDARERLRARYATQCGSTTSEDMACEYGRVLGAVPAAGGESVVFGGEDDRVYVAPVSVPRQEYPGVEVRGAEDAIDAAARGVGAAGVVRVPEPGGCEPVTWQLAKERVGTHDSFVAGVAVRGGLVASGGWDGRLMLWPLVANAGGAARPLSLLESAVRAFPDCEDGITLDDAGAGKLFWRVEWPEPLVMYVSTMENVSRRCLIVKVQIYFGLPRRVDDPDPAALPLIAADHPDPEDMADIAGARGPPLRELQLHTPLA